MYNLFKCSVNVYKVGIDAIYDCIGFVSKYG